MAATCPCIGGVVSGATCPPSGHVSSSVHVRLAGLRLTSMNRGPGCEPDQNSLYANQDCSPAEIGEEHVSCAQIATESIVLV